ncbi:MAG: AtpZ/AtpI family protein [Anaerolineae bacterium]|nr:AtpZ/AtpI family protein [Anaerolineae bacterium]
MSVPIIFGALFCGLWLDSTLDTKPAFTLILLVLSAPVSLVLMLQMVLRSVNQITPPPAVSTKHQIKDDDE